MRLRLGGLLIGCVLFGACSSGNTNKKPAKATDAGMDAGRDAGKSHAKCKLTLKPGDDDQSAILGALIDANSGDTVCLAGGRFELTGQLTLATDHVTVLGNADTVLDFSGQTSGANGIELAADHDTLDTLQIENTKGDAVRATQVDYPTIRNVHVQWTNGPSTDNGGYGIYPVTSSHVLIEHSYSKGASDTGIYVGQSHDIVIRDNEVEGNVAGIEIENSTDAEVYNNHSHDNTAGILVFNLPGLDVKDGKRANVHDNMVENNNLANFAAEGNIVHDVPQGTGMFVLASDANEIHGNTVQNHDSVGIAILSWYVALRDAEGKMDPAFDWYPEGNYVHDNTFMNNGKMPKDRAQLIASLVGVTENADVEWDGVIDTDQYGGDADAGTDSKLPDELRNCFEVSSDATFLEIDLANNGKHLTSDVTAFECTHPALPAITL